MSRQDQLLEALLTKNILQFKTLLTFDDVNPNYKYGKPYYSTCLEIACRYAACEKFISVLLMYVKPNSSSIYPQPIHYAAKRGNYKGLLLLLNDKRTKVNAVDSQGRTALYYALENFGKNCSNFNICVKLLVNHKKININCVDDDGFTPIFIAAHNKCKEGVKSLLKYAMLQNKFLNLDIMTKMGKTARSIILENYPDLKERLPSSNTIHCWEKLLPKKDKSSRCIIFNIIIYLSLVCFLFILRVINFYTLVFA